MCSKEDGAVNTSQIQLGRWNPEEVTQFPGVTTWEYMYIYIFLMQLKD